MLMISWPSASSFVLQQEHFIATLAKVFKVNFSHKAGGAAQDSSKSSPNAFELLLLALGQPYRHLASAFLSCRYDSGTDNLAANIDKIFVYHVQDNGQPSLIKIMTNHAK